MIDVVLLIVRLLFVALLYLFLFAIMKTGIGLVRGQRKKERTWNLSVEKGPRFQLMGQNLFVEDLGSTNGTGVNGQPITEPTALRNNDVVNVGDVAIRVRFA